MSVTQSLPGQENLRSWDDTLNTGWPDGFRLAEIRSTADGTVQKAWFYDAATPDKSPLIVSLHTWSGDYNQEDPLAAEVMRRGWNYIHPDFRGPDNRPEAGGSDLVISDIRDAIDFALRNSGADPGDVHIIGVSGGGYATLAAYMKLDYPVRSFNAWAAISDIEAWYAECRSRNLRYASDIERITTGDAVFDAGEARKRSPMYMNYNEEWRKNATLSLFAGITDGYNGSVPITHSISFYNRIINLKYPENKKLVVPDSVVIGLLARRYDPRGNYQKIAGRNIYLRAGMPDMGLTIFEGAHEMLVPHALSLLPLKKRNIDPAFEGTILVIGDSNAAGDDSWPTYLGELLPFSTVINTAVSGNTLGFDNLDREELNTLRNTDKYLDRADKAIHAGKPVTVLIALGTNDTKYIFRKRQNEVTPNLVTLIGRVRERLPEAKVIVISPPPIEESKNTTGKYTGSDRRVRQLRRRFEKTAIQLETGFIDLYGLLEEGFADKTVDGVHLDAQTRFNVAMHSASVISPAAWEGENAREPSGTIDSSVIIPPAWAFGVLYGGYTDQAGTIERIKAIQAHDYPIDAYWIDSWFWSYGDRGAGPAGYLDFAGDTVSFPDRRAMWSWMEANKIKGGFWIWDCILERGNEAVFREFLDKGFFSGVYLNTNPWHNSGTTTAMFSETGENRGMLCGNIDFENHVAVSYVGAKLKPLFEEGADFIKLDRTDRISVCRAVYEYTSEMGLETKGRGLILSHSRGTENDEYKRYPLKWSDDTRSDWTVESPLVSFDPWVPHVALKENIAMYTDPALSTSRIPFLTNDLGGFDMGKVEIPDEELFIRWMQFSMFCPVTEVFSQPENPTSNLAWYYSPYADSLFREYSHLRMKLFPWLYSYAHMSRLRGINIVRPLPGHLYEYMLGNELLVAPVYEKGVETRIIDLPEGRWIDYWTGDLLEGGKRHVIEAPTGRIPLLVREGAIIPERPYASSIERGSNDTLILNVYPGNDCLFTLTEDDGVSNDYLRGGYATTEINGKKTLTGFDITIDPVQGNYNGMTAYRTWIIKIYTPESPAKVLINGRTKTGTFNAADREVAIETGRINKNRETVVSIFFE